MIALQDFPRVRTFLIWAAAILSVIVVMAVFGLIGYRLFGHPSHPNWGVDPGIDLVYYDQKIDQWNWMNWLVTDWVLSLMAAGTAISAAIKNAFSSHNLAKAQIKAQEDGTTPPVPKSSGVDTAVMVLAALTVIATTLDAKMHATQQADRYRRSDLILQDAIGDYKNNADREALIKAWHQSQRVLEGAPEVLEKEKSTNGNTGSSNQSAPAATPTASKPKPQ